MANQSAVKRPSRPTIDSVTDNVEPHTGVIDPAGLTNDPRPVLSGRGDVGSIIHVRVDSIEVGTVEVGPGGAWTYQLPQPLPDGLFRLSARASHADMLSVPSQAYMIEVDVTPPLTPTIDHASADGAATLSGRAEPYSTVEVYDGKTLLGTATAGTNSQWAFPLPDGIAAGHHALTATATDSAGNASQASASFDYVVGPAQPAALAMVDHTASDSEVSYADGLTRDDVASTGGVREPALPSGMPVVADADGPAPKSVEFLFDFDGAMVATRSAAVQFHGINHDAADNAPELSLADVLSGPGHHELFRADGGAPVVVKAGTSGCAPMPGMPERPVGSNEGWHDTPGFYNAAQDVDLMVQSVMPTTLMA